MGFSLSPPSTLLCFFPLCPCLCRFISMTVPVLCLPLSLTFLVSGGHSLGLSLSSPQRPLTQHPVSLGWHRSAGYLGNDCRVSTCDWPGWGPTLGWWADLRGASLVLSPLWGRDILWNVKGTRVCHGGQGSQAGEGIPVLMRTPSCRMRPLEQISKKPRMQAAGGGSYNPNSFHLLIGHCSLNSLYTLVH